MFVNKNEYEMITKTIDNTEKIAISLSNSFINKDDENIVTNEEKQKQVAYALNLCTVSVSQIIDYDDLYILEQEYDSILNNLHLQNMPKDEPLLLILKQLLDTITFFRINNQEKKLLDQEYQQKVKNAIWSAVPNISVLVSDDDNPWGMIGCLATQVGIGYMNYRREKSNLKINKEKDEWKLQRSAIEQLNGLRRELFDTAWRLVAKYKIPEKYRLTESQIKQYNEILMDNDDIRRYERMEYVSEKYFEAYPPFWYYYGHTANVISLNALKENNIERYEKYRKLARSHFDKFITCNNCDNKLLRQDEIMCSCNLEYADLLDANIESEKEKILSLIKETEDSSGDKCDILQMCAYSYLKLKEYDNAKKLLKHLVNEQYNTVVNSQFLSALLVKEYLDEQKNTYDEYALLERKLPDSSKILFPFPQENDSLDELQKRFIQDQKESLKEKFMYVLNAYQEIYEIKFNKCIPGPESNKRYTDDFYSSCYSNDRHNSYYKLLTPKWESEFGIRLLNSDFGIAYLNILNSYVNNISLLILSNKNEAKNTLDRLSNRSIKEVIDDFKDPYESIVKKLSTSVDSVKIDTEILDTLFTYSFHHFTEKFVQLILTDFENTLFAFDSMDSITQTELRLREFCRLNGIPLLDDLLFNVINSNSLRDSVVYFDSTLLGDVANQNAAIVNKANTMAEIIKKYTDDLIIDKDNMIIDIARVNNVDLNTFFSKYKKSFFEDKRQKIVAVLHDSVEWHQNLANRILVFTVDGVVCLRTLKGKIDLFKFLDDEETVDYRDVSYETSDCILIKKHKYRNKGINLDVLNALFQELAVVSQETKSIGKAPLKNLEYQK